jgi:hypothetical protein
VSFLRTACCFLAFCLFSNADASATDYTVSYAFNAGDSNVAGKARCEYKSDCKIELKKLNLTITLRSRDPIYWNRAVIEISGDGSRWGCCYFVDGMDEVVRDLTAESPIRLGVYVGRRQGHPRRSSEYLVNEPLGILYLHFLDVN